MPLISYHSTIISSIASPREAVDTTSSQILLSRGVADPNSMSLSSTALSSPSATVASYFESPTSSSMTLADAATPVEHIVVNPWLDARKTDGGLDTESDGHNVDAGGSGAEPAQNCTNITVEAHSSQDSSGYFTEPPNNTRVVVTSKQVDLDRGRTLERLPRLSNPLSLAESRIRNSGGGAAIELDTRSFRKRVSRSSAFYDDPSNSSAILDDRLLEPCPHEPVCKTLSEVLNSPISPTSFSATVSRTDSCDRHISLVKPMALSTTLNVTPDACDSEPAQVAKCVIEEVPLANNSENREGKGPVLFDREPKASEGKHPPSNAASLPAEILHQIFYSLGPAEFHAARHTCRIWFIASLAKPILETMIRRGGYVGSIRQDLNANHVIEPDLQINDEWLISKRLARECALGPEWTGNGLDRGDAQKIPHSGSAFKDLSTIDFTEVGVHNPGTDYLGTVFTVSNCGKFLMAVNGCLVYVYELNCSVTTAQPKSSTNSGALRPITSIVCPHRVLACSMDTSSHRYAIAILLEGRMGLVCAITALNNSYTQSEPPQVTQDNAEYSESKGSKHREKEHPRHEELPGIYFLDRVCLNSSSSIFGSATSSLNPPRIFPGIETFGSNFAPTTDSQWYDVYREEVPQSQNSSLPKAGKARNNSRLKSIMPPHRISRVDETTMPIETGPRSLYRNLCSNDDPPRSVAICPQRRCVAFGCSSGIELHWVDALTGQDLNRWFPLTAPSDYLFFLPPRKGVDSAKKLRLISSAARPSDQPTIAERAFGRRHQNSSLLETLGRTSSASRSGPHTWNGQAFATRISGYASIGQTGLGRTELSDHYRAVPLSDGYHILFTDPVTGLLCLGSDAPVGGPTKLLRKIWFHAPGASGSPIVYASGSDLSWGVRVVAAFGTEAEQSVWLFTVPHDIFVAEESPNQSGQPLCTSVVSSKNLQDWEWLGWIEQVSDPNPDPHSRTFWPIKITGQEIGRFQGITDLALDSGPCMTIWAFSKTGIAKVWKLDDGRSKEPKMALVVQDGTVRNIDAAGDVEMFDISPSAERIDLDSPLISETFDGTSSIFASVVPTRYNRRLRTGWSQYSANNDADSDILMHDADSDVLMEDLCFLDGLNEIDNESFEHDINLMVRAEASYNSSRLERIGVGAKHMVEELTGIARSSIEVR